MKNATLVRRVLCLTVAWCAISYSLYTQKHPSLAIVMDRAFSESACADIRSALHEAHCSSVDDVVAFLSGFSSVATVNKENRVGGLCCITVVAHKPCAIVNDSFVVLSNRTVIPRGMYTQEVLSLLNDAHVAGCIGERDQLSVDEFHFITQLSRALVDQFEVTWRDVHHVICLDKRAPVHVLLEPQQVFDATTWKRYKRVTQYVEGNHMTGSKKGPVGVDMRFGPYVVMGKRGV